MPTRDGIIILVSELEQDVVILDALVQQNTQAINRVTAGATDNLDYAALGYTIHNLYSLVESYALRIAKTFENRLDERTWHSDLVRRMTLEIPTIRPALWERPLSRHIDELRRFRHAFRHIYDSNLDPEKLMIVQKHVGPAMSGFKASHSAFLEKLNTLAEHLD